MKWGCALIGALLAVVLLVGRDSALRAADPPEKLVISVFHVDGMTCGGCEAGLRLRLGKLDGVVHVDASYTHRTVRVTHDPIRATPAQITAAIETLGYKAKLDSSEAVP